MLNKIDISQEVYDYLESKRNDRTHNPMTFEKSQWYARALNDLEDYIQKKEIEFDLAMEEQKEIYDERSELLRHELQYDNIDKVQI